jgi:hypothetical protein
MEVAVLFVENDSVYKQFPNVDCWDIVRDARNYQGDLPVIAHPPCQLWGALASVNYARWGGEHNKPCNDDGLFEFALNTVKRCGGVLEHPAKTFAWKYFGIPKPNGIGWQRILNGAWVCEVWQNAYGHKANKATWLYYVGANPPLQAKWERKKGSCQIGFYDQRGKNRNKPTLSKTEANATPIEFAQYLIRLAINSK